jgi:hypothetical protein
MRDLARGSSPFGSTLSTLQQAHEEAQSAPLSMLSYKNMFDKAMESLELIYPGFASGDYSMKTTVVYDGYSHVLYDSVLRFIEKFNPDSDAIKPLSTLPADDMSHLALYTVSPAFANDVDSLTMPVAANGGHVFLNNDFVFSHDAAAAHASTITWHADMTFLARFESNTNILAWTIASTGNNPARLPDVLISVQAGDVWTLTPAAASSLRMTIRSLDIANPKTLQVRAIGGAISAAKVEDLLASAAHGFAYVDSLHERSLLSILDNLMASDRDWETAPPIART